MPPEPKTGSTDELQQDTRRSAVLWHMRDDAWVPGLTVLWHPQVERIGDRVALPQLASGRDVAVSRLEPTLADIEGRLARPLALAHLSRTPFRLRPAVRGGLRLLRESCTTSIEVDGTALESERMLSSDELERGVVLLLAERIVLLLHRSDPTPPRDLPGFGLIGASREVERLRRRIASVVDLDVPVLLRGETGSGKELAAQAIHSHGPRRLKQFVGVNMGAISPSLAAAELFGAARGAYTGSQGAQAGCFRRAHGGTLFLDEIGETPAEVQVMLLRVLETRRVRSLGEDVDRPVDVRLIAATDSALETAVEAGRFRAPLLHRLGGSEIAMPALRARREDFGRLLLAFLHEELEPLRETRRLGVARAGHAPWLPAPLVARLARLDWPGNVRQLRNVCRELVVLGRNRDQVAIGPQLERLLGLSGGEPTAASPRAAPAPEPPSRFRRPGDVGEGELLDVLAANRWRLKPAAAQLRISRTSLYALIQAHPGLRNATDLRAPEMEDLWRTTGGNVQAMSEALRISEAGIRRRLRELGLPTRTGSGRLPADIPAKES